MDNRELYNQYSESDSDKTIASLIANWNGSYERLIKYGNLQIHEKLVDFITQENDIFAARVLTKLYRKTSYSMKKSIVMWIGELIKTGDFTNECTDSIDTGKVNAVKDLLDVILTYSPDDLLKLIASFIDEFELGYAFSVKIVEILAGRIDFKNNADHPASILIGNFSNNGMEANEVRELYEIKDRIMGVRK